MADRVTASAPNPEDLRARLRERLSALKGELERLRFETDRRWDELLARLTERPEEIVPEELLRQAAPVLHPSAPPGSIAADALRRLDSAASQVEALTRFLEECRAHASRAALFVERRRRFEVWKCSGFEDSGAEARAATIDSESALARVREGVPQLLGRGNEISLALGAHDATEALLVPFVVREKVSGAVYADASEDRVLDRDAVATLTWIAGLVVDRLARRKFVPAPSLRAFESTRPASPPAAAESFASTPPCEQPAAPLPRDDGLPTPPPAAVPATTERTLGGPLAPAGAEGEREEARRFARLLASEIKLYNELEVTEGRKRGDLYARLREDIERGRRLYEERVPSDVRSGADYYYEELVQILAGGRAEALR